MAAEADAEARRIRAQVDLAALRDLEKAAGAFTDHPALLRIRELDAMHALAQSANARLYIDFQNKVNPPTE
jgi:hypothetical protein